MQRALTINRNNDFKRIYARGKSRVTPLLVVYAMRNRVKAPRVAFVSSKKVGNAVQRNRARRVVRAALKESGAVIPTGWDVVFVCRARTVFCKSTELEPVIKKQLTELLKSGEGKR